MAMLKLVVIRSPDPDALHAFYQRLGLSFDYHRHGASPYHYSTAIGGTVLELYPLAKEQAEADKHLRLGFEVQRFDEMMAELKQAGTPFVKEPEQTDFGFRAIVRDPDGRTVELYKPSL